MKWHVQGGEMVSHLAPACFYCLLAAVQELHDFYNALVFFADSSKRFYTYIKICPLEGRPFHRMRHLYARLWTNTNPAASPGRMLANIVMWKKKSLTSWAKWHHCSFFFLPWALRRKHHRHIEATVAVWLMCQTAHLEGLCLRRLASLLESRICGFDWLGWMVQHLGVCDWFFLTIPHCYSVSSASLFGKFLKWLWHYIAKNIPFFPLCKYALAQGKYAHAPYLLKSEHLLTHSSCKNSLLWLIFLPPTNQTD